MTLDGIPRERDRCDQRANRRRRAQQTETDRSDRQNIPRVDRQQGSRAAENDDKQVERDHAKQAPPAADVVKARKHGGERRRIACRDRPFGLYQGDQRYRAGEKYQTHHANQHRT